MLFDDIFYPGNPGRRADVANLRADIRSAFYIFRSSWNDCANLLNPILITNHPDCTLSLINCNVDSDCLQMCVEEFNRVLVDAKPKLDKVVADIGLTQGIPGLPPGNLNLDPDAMHKISMFLAGAVDVSVAAFASWYVYSAFRFVVMVANYAGAAISGVAEIVGGLIGGMVVGAVGFVITDMIASAIAGAVERKELNEAIDALTQIKNNVADPLLTAAARLGGIRQAVQDGSYKVSDTLLIVKVGSVYQVIQLVPQPSLQEAKRLHKNGALYLVLDGISRHIKDPAMYNNLFVDWNGYIDTNDVDPMGAELPGETSLAKGLPDGKVYLIVDGTKRWITSPTVFNAFHFDWNKIQDKANLLNIPDGAEIVVPA
jgi:hypothetical protein